MHNPESVLEYETPKFIWDSGIQTENIISAGRPDLVIIYKRRTTCRIEDFAVSTDHKVKLKEIKKSDKGRDFDRELKKKLLNMKVTVIPIVIGAPGTISKWLVKGQKNLEIREQVETIQTTALSKSARILWRVLETWG